MPQHVPAEQSVPELHGGASQSPAMQANPSEQARPHSPQF
jgi:hypothetical protein